MNAPDQVLFDKINQLPPQRLAELEDFVDFLRTREDDHRLAAAAAKARAATPAPADEAARKPPVELGSKDDFQLMQALAHLKGEPVKGQPPKTVADAKAN